MRSNYRDEVNKILASLDDDKNNQETEPKTEIPATPSPEPLREIHFIFVREEDEQEIIDSDVLVEDLDTTPLPTQQAPQPTSNVAIAVWLFGLLVPLFCIAVQLYFIINPFTVNVTLLARSQQLSLTGTLQLGRELNPITLSQSQTVPTTGKGHQDARSATGYITFYNGQLQSVTVPAGTYLTSTSGIQVITDADANIPAADPTANPPVFGQTTVPAHAVNSGSRGNIPTYDISQPCCLASVIAKNLQSFTGGQDERNFQTVAKSDIDNTAAPLKDTLTQSLQGALTGQLKNGETLKILPCNPTVIPDRHTGQEATQVKVTVSLTCSGIAYNDQELTDKVTQLLTSQATTKLGAGYSILGNPQITVNSATTAKQVILSFTTVSTWAYALTSQEQEHIKTIMAGKTKQQALQLLYSLPGIESVSMQSSGFGDDNRIPKDTKYIHLLIIYASA